MDWFLHSLISDLKAIPSCWCFRGGFAFRVSAWVPNVFGEYGTFSRLSLAVAQRKPRAIYLCCGRRANHSEMLGRVLSCCSCQNFRSLRSSDSSGFSLATRSCRKGGCHVDEVRDVFVTVLAVDCVQIPLEQLLLTARKNLATLLDLSKREVFPCYHQV